MIALEFRQAVEHARGLRRGVTGRPDITLANLAVVSKVWWRGQTLPLMEQSRSILWSPLCRLLKTQVLYARPYRHDSAGVQRAVGAIHIKRAPSCRRRVEKDTGILEGSVQSE